MPDARRADLVPVQLEFPIERDPDVDLPNRLRHLGWPPHLRLTLQSNRTVLISVHPRTGARVHRGFAYAPDGVLQALIQYAKGGKRRGRVDARPFLEFPVHDFVPTPAGRARSDRESDRPVLERLQAMHGVLNARHFEGQLQSIRIALSLRMRRRLGELRLERRSNRVTEIVIGVRHLRRDGWREVELTLLHEMVHQWQAETGRPVDHGPEFRRKASEVGIEARAARIHRLLDGSGRSS